MTIPEQQLIAPVAIQIGCVQAGGVVSGNVAMGAFLAVTVKDHNPAHFRCSP